MNRAPLRHNRDAALEAGLHQFWRNGFHATSMKDLEQATGMHPGSLYAAFDSKLGFFTAALNRYADAAASAIRAAVEAGDTPMRGLAAYVSGFADSGEAPAPACMLVKTLLEAREADHPLRDGAERGLAAIEGAIRDALAAAEAANQLRDDIVVETAAQRIQLNLIGLRSFACRPGDRARVRVLAASIADEIVQLERVDLSHRRFNGEVTQ
jgi:TetR/AcrR family transcriptional repressor of nem operon